MNILVATISAFSRSKEMRNYKIRIPDCDVEEISASHTNESIIKCVAEIEAVKSSGGISKVLALVTNKTLSSEFKNPEYDNLTSFEYYKSVVEDSSPNVQVVPIYLETSEGHAVETSEILSQICDNIGLNDVVYIDGAGGQRTISNLIQLLTKILKYIGIENPYNLYANIQNNPPFISDTSEFDRMTDLADAFNEFMTTGKSDQLSRCMIHQDTDEEYKRLLVVMGEFSDKIRLGNVESIDRTIVALKECIIACKKLESSMDIETVIIRQFLPAIEEKLIGRNTDEVDYSRIVAWCLDNVLIQQAITLFVEKLPRVLFDKKVIVYRGNLKEDLIQYDILKKKNKTYPADWHAYALYTDLMGDVSVAAVSSGMSLDPVTDEFRNCLKNGLNSTNRVVMKALKEVRSFDNSGLRSASNSSEAKIVRQLTNERNFSGFGKLVNTICNEPRLLASILGTANEITTGVHGKDSNTDGETTLLKKFDCLAKWKRQNYKNYDINVPNDQIIEALYAYLYVKAIRNQINHASSDELLTNRQKDILRQYGYVFNCSDLKEIRRNVMHALEAFKACYEVKQAAEVLPKEYSTNYQVGDVCMAQCVRNKLVRIEDHDYDIQMVVPKGLRSTDYIGETVQVKIKQISSAQKVVQVEIVIS